MLVTSRPGEQNHRLLSFSRHPHRTASRNSSSPNVSVGCPFLIPPGFLSEKFWSGRPGSNQRVQLGNFLLKMMFFIFQTRTYFRFCAPEIFFLRLVISTSFKPSTFVSGTFWARENAVKRRVLRRCTSVNNETSLGSNDASD